MYPIWLVQLGGILGDVFGIEVVVSGGDEGFIIDDWFLIRNFPRERVLNRLDIIDISIFLLFSRAYFFVVLFKFLGGCKSR